MVTLSQSEVATGVVIIALWLGVAAWAVATGLLLRRRADASLLASKRERTLGHISPALPLLVGRGGEVDAGERLFDWFGLKPATIKLRALLEQGVGPADRDRVLQAVDDARRSGMGFELALRPQGSTRTLLLQGGPAPSDVADGGILIWVFDATTKEAEIERLQAEEAKARQAFETLSRLIEAAPVAMWHRGPDLRLTLVNRAYVEAVEAVSAEDVISRGVELVEATGISGPIASAAEARELNEVRSRVVPATVRGQRRSIRIVDVPLGAAGVAGYAIDNDELERALTAFRRFVETQRDTLDRLSAGVAQFAADRTLTFSNQPFQRLFALKPEWVSDRPEFERVLDRMREAGRIPEARDYASWRSERRQWFVSASGAQEESWLLPGGTHLRVVVQPLPDGGLLLIFEDRTEQVQLASARDTLLRVREATFDNLFEAVGVFAGDGRLHLWNNRFRDVWGFDRKLLQERPRVDALAEAVAPKLANPDSANLMRELVRGATVERQGRSGRIALKDGRHFEFAGVPLPDGNALFTMLDITDSRRIERMLRERAEALEQSSKVKTDFVANMSYELRTPLTSIGGFAEMLANGYAGELPEQAQGYVGAILAAVDKLTHQVNEVLEMAQSDAGLAPSDRERVELAPLLLGVAEEARLRADGSGIEFVTDVDRGVGRATISSKRLRQLVLQAVDASLASSTKARRVLLHASRDGERINIVVSDNGAGKGLDKRVQQSLREQVEELHGTLVVSAEGGLGTAITMTLPQ